ncbi:MAG TPA: PQQ-binding-like beta-propeller repeat protein [Gemmataceae bacterium]|nr:PQQ-binding-like beta-propeller repeat protein [Gemmataceae bacterium]
MFAIVIFLFALTQAAAGDWPQFLGRDRNGISKETGLVDTFPRSGPPQVWKKEVGEGFSGPVVAGERLILFHRVGNEEVVECLNAGSGKGVWKFAYPTNYQDQLGKGDGPRSTPVIAGKNVITLGAEGMLHCIDIEKGKKIWARNIIKDYSVPQSYFGVGTSPLVEGKLVLVNVGGKGAGIVAFALDSGKEIWKATGDGASYSSPVATTIAGTRLAVFFTRQGAVILDPLTGKVIFQKRWRARYDASVNAATPLVIGDRVFLSASYETGALLLRLKKDGADVLWSNDNSMSNHYNTCVHQDGHLYGIDGRQERGPSLRCIDLKAGKVMWDEAGFGCANLILAEGKLIALTEKGDLVLAAATPAAYREKARARILEDGPCRAQMALANGLLYARDQKTLACWKLQK